MRRQRVFSLFLLTLLLGCRPRDHEASKVDALPQARAILGPAQAWEPFAFDADTLNRSIRSRRSAGWATVARALQRVAIIDPTTGEPMRDGRGEPLSVPLWQTWYELNEFRKMMDELWAQLSPEQRQQRRSDPEIVDTIMRKHHEQKLLSKWSRPDPEGKTRFQRLLSQIRSPEELSALNGVSGQGYTLHSPEVIRHYLLHYGEAVTCQGHAATHTTGDNESDLATCFGGKPFPKGAASVKATWNSGSDGVAAFDTSAAGLNRMLSESAPTWRPHRPDQLHYPSSDTIYSSYVFEDDRRGPMFRLTGLHITTKDIPEWLWVSLWWAPNPDEDFGEDRPAAIGELGPSGAVAVWKHYKMCVVSSFEEGDPSIKLAAAANDKSLHAAIVTAYQHAKPGTFCSNPYIEFQHGVANSNCIGCHQHAGPYASGTSQAPDRSRQRTSFMSDFLWSFESPRESFRGTIEEIITH